MPKTRPANRYIALEVFLWTLVAIGIVFRLANPFFNNPSDFMQSDPMRHFLSARECLSNVNQNWTLFEIIDPLGYQIWLSAILRITGNDRAAVAIYCGALSLLTAWFWYQWMKLCIGNKRWALAGYACLSLLPDWTKVFQYYLQETLVLPLLGLSLWLSWETALRPTPAKFAGTGLTWGCTLLTKVTALPMAAVVFAWMFWRSSPGLRNFNTKQLKLPLISLSIALLVYALGPIKIYNRIHAFVPIPGGDFHRACYERGNDYWKCKVKYLDTLQGFRVFDIEAGQPSLDLRLPAPLQWKSTRKGTAQTEVDFTSTPLNYYPPSQMSLQDRLHYTWENIVYFFLGLSWPEATDTRDFGLHCELMRMVRFIWLPMTLVIVFLTIKQRRLDIMTLLFSVSLLFFLLQQSVIMEARYKKPWEGVAIATLLALLAQPKAKNTSSKNWLT
jgi:hypothetical protein